MAHEKWSGCCNPRISNGASPTGSRWPTARVRRQELEISVSLRILFGPPAVLSGSRSRGRSGRRGKGRRLWWTVEPGLPAVLFDAPLQLAAIIGAPPSSQVGEQSDSIPLTGTAPSARGKLGTYLGDAVHSVIQVLASVLQCEDGGPIVVRPVVYLEQEKENPSRSNQRGYGHPRPRAEAVGRFCSWASSHPQR